MRGGRRKAKWGPFEGLLVDLVGLASNTLGSWEGRPRGSASIWTSRAGRHPPFHETLGGKRPRAPFPLLRSDSMHSAPDFLKSSASRKPGRGLAQHLGRCRQARVGRVEVSLPSKHDPDSGCGGRHTLLPRLAGHPAMPKCTSFQAPVH